MVAEGSPAVSHEDRCAKVAKLDHYVPGCASNDDILWLDVTMSNLSAQVEVA